MALYSNRPITNCLSIAGTLYNRVKDRFDLARANQIKELDQASTISFTLDVWTSPNHRPILAVIGHWITVDFEYKEVLVAFVVLKGRLYPSLY